MDNSGVPDESDARRDERELSHQHRRWHTHQALERVQQRLRVAPPASRAHAVAEQERSRRLVLSLSGPPPTSSDEEVGCIPLGVMNRPGSTFSRDASVRIQTRLSGTGLS
ncbi:hypothetical protein B0H14DRAFT_3461740 [Mycena olivaceomarginata]|nr:hypothetical protein B0H14DRAFT_3461740 [Mycena olivaceomarginata]